MDKNVQVFTNGLFGNLTVFEIFDSIWFVGKEVASALGYVDTDQALRDHVLDCDKTLINNQFLKPVEMTGFKIPNRGLTIINESGLYNLIFTSRLPAAIEFRHWVTSEVLPTMRKIGFDRSLQLLQEERDRLAAENSYLKQLNGEMSLTNTVTSADNLYLQHFIISNPNLSIQEKIESFKYDPSLVNPDIDLNNDIQCFKIMYMKEGNIE